MMTFAGFPYFPAMPLRSYLFRVLLVAHTIAVAASAHAHGLAEWIERGGYRNVADELCCGEKDCAELAAGDVDVVPHGYLVKSINEFVPYEEAQPSPDGHYWRCAWGGARRCFFAPPGAV
jgi:hypothetical protein